MNRARDEAATLLAAEREKFETAMAEFRNGKSYFPRDPKNALNDNIHVLREDAEIARKQATQAQAELSAAKQQTAAEIAQVQTAADRTNEQWRRYGITAAAAGLVFGAVLTPCRFWNGSAQQGRRNLNLPEWQPQSLQRRFRYKF